MIKKMQKLICTLFFQGIEKSKISEIVTSQLRLLGFTPNYLKAGEKEISYDLNALIDWIEKGERSIRIMSKPSVNSSMNYWALFEFDENYKVLSLSWRNDHMGFLIDKKDFIKLLLSEKFLYGICYDMSDAFNESCTNIEYMKNVVGKKKISTIKDQFGDLIVNISNNCGRKERVNGLEFIAAPIMWFGNKFNEFIPWQDILKFGGSESVKTQDGEYVLVKLFELSEDPSLEKNRKKQCQFWSFFNLQEVIQEYEKRTAIDLDAYMRELIERKKKRKQ